MPAQLKLEETRKAISFNWMQINNWPRQEIISGFVQAITRCQQTRKEELVLRDIAPESRIGRDDPSQVVEIHDRITGLFSEAVNSLMRDIPQVRLNLNRGQFDMRFYIGREIPRDCIYDEER